MSLYEDRHEDDHEFQSVVVLNCFVATKEGRFVLLLVVLHLAPPEGLFAKIPNSSSRVGHHARACAWCICRARVTFEIGFIRFLPLSRGWREVGGGFQCCVYSASTAVRCARQRPCGVRGSLCAFIRA